jgi:hypothetical protein
MAPAVIKGGKEPDVSVGLVKFIRLGSTEAHFRRRAV